MEDRELQHDIRERKDDVSDKIDALLAAMNVDEKVGQMTQIDLNLVLEGGIQNRNGEIDPSHLETAVNIYKVGSIINYVNNAYRIETWHKIVTAIQHAALKTTHRIPVLYGINANHGAAHILDATIFPHNIGLASSRNPALAYKTAVITALETRASGIRWNFDPVLDIGRNPLWPRFEETFGEDPVVATGMGPEIIKGYQGKNLSDSASVASTMRHFLGYSNPRTGRDRTPASIPEIELREFELPQYRKAIEAGASAVIINSGEVNGVPVHANRYLLTKVLRQELGFEGIVLSDWQDIYRLYERHNIAPTLKDAVRVAVLAGIDIGMTLSDFKFSILLKELYEEYRDIAAMVDQSVRRILTLKFKLGLFDNPYPEPEAHRNFNKPAYSTTAHEAALESITLLKNDSNILPLSKSATILLAGPGANNLTSLHGNRTFTWQGDRMDYYPSATKTIREAFEQKIGSSRVISLSVPDYEHQANYNVQLLKSLAEGVDCIVLCLGENAYAESPGSIQDLTLESRQIALAEAALTTGKPVVVILTQGRPRIISSFADSVQGIVLAYRPGSQGARAIADVVFGEYNPGGKLPFSYPRHTGDMVHYDHKWTEVNVEKSPGRYTEDGYNPQFPFGHGLSYTTFQYSRFTTDRKTFSQEESLRVSVSVKNTGNRAGDEVIELYSRQMHASVTPSMRRLRKFQRITLEPGEEREVVFSLTAEDLAYTRYGQHRGEFVSDVEEGEIRLMVGGFGFEIEEPGNRADSVCRPYKNSISISYRSR